MDQRLLLMHQMMLADRTRMRAYDRALEQAVGPGDVVVDVGAGTLALAVLALRHGAEHVYAIEADPQAASLAEQLIRGNDLKGRITLVQGDARAVSLPRKVDVIVSEMMGNLGPEENMMDVVATVARRNLRPDGRIVPRGLETRLAAIEFDDEGWGIWSEDHFGFHLDSVLDFAEPQAQLHFFQRPPRLLCPPATALAGTGRARAKDLGRQRLRITEPGRLHAVVGYFVADLADGITLTNFPSYPGCNWAVWVWPLRHTTVDVGDEALVRLYPPADRRSVRLAADWRLDCGLVRGGDR